MGQGRSRRGAVGRTLGGNVRVLVVIVALAAVAALVAWGPNLPRLFAAGVSHVATMARQGMDWVLPSVSRSLELNADQAVRVVTESLPRYWSSDHEPPPKVPWVMTLRSWIYTLTGYDFSQPGTFLEAELRGYAAMAQSLRGTVRGPSSGNQVPPVISDGRVGSPLPTITVEPQVVPPAGYDPQSDQSPQPDSQTPIPDTPGIINEPQTPTEPIRIPTTLDEVLAAARWGDEPLIAIIHTHPSEMYRTDTFAPANGHSYHQFDTVETGIVRVGARLAQTLWETYGIPTIHDLTLHNTPCHSCAYVESRKTVQELLRKYPSLMYIIDVHRDGAEDVSMLASVGEESVAQVALVVGRPGTRDIARHPGWEENNAFAHRVGTILSESYPGVFRRVLHLTGVYNQDLHPRAMLVEIGNYYDHEAYALRTAELFARVLAEALYEEIHQIRPVVPDVVSPRRD